MNNIAKYHKVCPSLVKFVFKTVLWPIRFKTLFTLKEMLSYRCFEMKMSYLTYETNTNNLFALHSVNEFHHVLAKLKRSQVIVIRFKIN